MMDIEKIQAIIENFGELVVDKSEPEKSTNGNKSTISFYLYFKDESKMKVFYSLVVSKMKFRYSFQWMQSDNSLLIRWDNTPHSHNVSTMPHHKHVGTTQNVQESEPMDLLKVLTYIAKVVGVIGLIIGIFWWW